MTVGSDVVWSSRNGEEHGILKGRVEEYGVWGPMIPIFFRSFCGWRFTLLWLLWDDEMWSVVVIIVGWAWTYFHGFLLLGSNTTTQPLFKIVQWPMAPKTCTAQLMGDFCGMLYYNQHYENGILEASLSFLQHLTAECWVVKRSSFMLLLGQSPRKMGFILTNYYSPREIGWAQL